jgi:hypothetical protein
VVEWESMAARAKRGCETEAAPGNRREKQKKDVKSWEQTEGFIESKGVRGFQGEKQTGFLAQKPPNKAKKGAQNAEFRGWKRETGNTDLGRCPSPTCDAPDGKWRYNTNTPVGERSFRW